MADTPMEAAIPPKLDLKRGIAPKPVVPAAPAVVAPAPVIEPVPAPAPAPVAVPVQAPASAPVEVKVMPVPVVSEVVAEAVPVPVEPSVAAAQQKPATVRLTIPQPQSPVVPVAPAPASVAPEAPAPVKPLSGPVVKPAFPRPAVVPGSGIRPVVAVGASPIAGKTVRLRADQPGQGPVTAPRPAMVVASAAKPASVAAAPAQIAKKETSKIPLELAQPAPAKLPDPVLKVVSGPAAAGAPTLVKSPAILEGSSPEVIASKRKTSRISLDSVLTGSGPAQGGPQAPKTIKLKRPSEAVTIKSVKPAVGGEPSKTARLDDSVPAEAEASEGGKKTIKVQRHGGAHPIHTSGASAAPVAVGQSGPVVIVDKCNPFFPIWTLISFILAIVVIWMFCAQTFGLDYCLTRFSYSANSTTDAVDLPWPGKLRRGMQ